MAELSAPLLETKIPELPPPTRGKVRDVYDLGDRLLIVATDRISAYDVVLPTGIPDKGVVLTQLSLFWFEELSDIVPNHLLSADSLVISRRADIVSSYLSRWSRTMYQFSSTCNSAALSKSSALSGSKQAMASATCPCSAYR